MKRSLTLVLFLSLLLISACSNGNNNVNNTTNQNNQSENATNDETITYESENGPIEVPADPQRVVVLSSYAGDLIELGVPVVGADEIGRASCRERGERWVVD